MADRVPITYTFGNHMHWADMEWLWGYEVLPSSVRDMLHFCQELGAKGNVNFDGVGYEKMASECPDALAELKQAVHNGTVEIVGGSYGQPYGLFHGGESNVRQRIYGVRTCKRLLGKRPETFWEEECDFFPQLPQILGSCGYKYASLFFQWTWHTPEVPKEDVPVVWWEGQDGSSLLTATRNRLNLHQWPEDIQILMDELAATGTANGDLILQWLELMPTQDWMCRSEVLLPKTKELLGDPRFDVTFATLGEYLSKSPQDVPTRRYTMDDIWHGMTLGKNGDRMRRYSRDAEASLLTAETTAAIASLLGRPYAQWDVYPTWELEEAWRELLQAQHHDNCECEGLCGRVGVFSYQKSMSLSRHVRRANLDRIVAPFGDDPMKPRFVTGEQDQRRPGHGFVFNPHGWATKAQVAMGVSRCVEVPPYGYVLTGEVTDRAKLEQDLVRDDLIVTISDDQRIGQFMSREFPNGVFSQPGAFGFSMVKDKKRLNIANVGFSLDHQPNDMRVNISLMPERRALDVDALAHIDRPDGGMNSGLTASIPLSFRPRIITDQPYGISEVHPHGSWPKKYPTGDWMTSPQWFEEVDKPFTSLTLVDLIDADQPDRGLLIVHGGSQQWFLGEGNEINCLVNAYDPWDGDYFHSDSRGRFWLIPHGPMTNSERWRTAQEILRPPTRRYYLPKVDEPEVMSFSLASCTPENVVMTALYREMIGQSKIDGYAADWEYPFVLRLVEFDGIESIATVRFNSTIARAIRTDLMGCSPSELEVTDNTIQFPMRPFEIATVYLDIVEGRKQFRDLDAKREIWATVHRM